MSAKDKDCIRFLDISRSYLVYTYLSTVHNLISLQIYSGFADRILSDLHYSAGSCPNIYTIEQPHPRPVISLVLFLVRMRVREGAGGGAGPQGKGPPPPP